MGLKFTRINMGGPNKDFGFQLCLMERPMIEVKSVTLHQFHFLHKTGLAKVHQGSMFVLTTQVNSMLSILNRYGFVLEKRELNDLTISLLADGTIISSTGLFTNSMSYISFKDIIRSIKSDFPESVCYNVVSQLSIYLDYMKSKAQQKYEFKTLKTQALNFLVQGDFLSDGVKWEYKKKAEKPGAMFVKPNQGMEGNNIVIPHFTKEGLELPGGVIIKCSIPDKPGQPTGQVDDFPKINGVWMGEKKLGSSQKKRMKIGSITLQFTRIIKNGFKRYRLDSIEGVYNTTQLPERYLSGSPHIVMTYSWSSCLTKISGLQFPNGKMLLIIGESYSKSLLISKLEYLVKAGERLRDIKRVDKEKQQRQKEFNKEQSWEGSFIIQV